MGGPSGSSGTPSNSSPQAVAYQPTAQPQSDALYQALLGGFAGSLSPAFANQFSNAFGTTPTTNPFSSTPGGVSYNLASPFVGGAGTGTLTDPNNPYYQQAIGNAEAATGGVPSIFGTAGALGGGIGNILSALPYASNLSSGIGNQTAGGLGYYLPSMLTGGLNTALAGQAGSNNFVNYLQPQNTGLTSGLGAQALSEQQGLNAATTQSLNAEWPVALGGAAADVTSANNILTNAFDPQQALFNQQQNLLTQQAAAANAAAGLGGSAYGASNTANALGNFDINWQNQQLARQESGLASAMPAYSTAAQLPMLPITQATAAYGTENQLPYQPLEMGGQIQQGINNLNSQAAQLPASVGAGLANLAGTTGQLPYQSLSGLESALSGVGSIANTQGGLYNAGSTLAGLPYNTLSTGTNNALSALGNYSNLGNQQYAIPQQLGNDLQSYLQLGQAASGLSGQLGALGQQELGSSLAGIGSALGTGSNLLFGNQGLSGALGLGSGGLLGSLGGGGAAAGLGGLTAGTGALDVGGGGELASGLATSAVGAADAGGGFSLGSLLPFGAAS